VTARALGRLMGQNLRRGRRSFVLSVFGIAVGISSLAFFLALSSGVRGVVLGRVFPVGEMEVVPARSTLEGPLGLLSALSGPRPLTDDVVAELRARPEVQAAYRRMKLAFPARAAGGAALFGRDVRAELIAEGVDAAALEGEPTAPEPFTDELGSQRACAVDADCSGGEYCPDDAQKCERPVPVVLSPFLLEVYNGAIAPSHHLPRLGKLLAGRLRGFTFTAELGQSLIGTTRPSSEPPRTRRLMLVGIAPRAAQLAATLPIGVVARWNRAYAGEAAAHELSSVLLVLRPGADAARLAAAVRQLGLAVADSGAERAALAILGATLLFALVSFAVIAVAAINIAHSFFRAVAERQREIGVLRAVGASARDVLWLVLAEASAIGLAGGLAGLALARLGALALDLASRRLLPDFPFKPDSYFSFDWPILGGALLCSIAACVLGAWWPARAAARLEPAAALAAP
jgi:hypothetical protein